MLVNFGIKKQGGAVKRYLSLNALDKGGEFYKLSVSSVGTVRDINRVFPVLLAAAFDPLTSQENVSREVQLSEDTLAVIAMKHFTESK